MKSKFISVLIVALLYGVVELIHGSTLHITNHVLLLTYATVGCTLAGIYLGDVWWMHTSSHKIVQRTWIGLSLLGTSLLMLAPVSHLHMMQMTPAGFVPLLTWGAVIPLIAAGIGTALLGNICLRWTRNQLCSC